MLAQRLYEAAADPIGVAGCGLREADWLCAGSSSPLVYNLFVQASAHESSDLAPTSEREEFKRAAPDQLAQAARLYDRVEATLRSLDAPRAVAALRLRRGYLSGLHNDWETARHSALLAAEQAHQCGDQLLERLAQTHVLMADVGLGHTGELSERARALGTWGADSGSFSFALGLGILLGRWGRRWLLREGDYERALAAIDAAGELYRALGAPINVVQTLVDRGRIHLALHDRHSALTYYEEALERRDKDLRERPELADAPIAQGRAVSYLPNASVLQFAQPATSFTRPASDAVLVVGNPTRDLPGAEREAAQVAELFGTSVLSHDATEAKVRQRAERARVLHFATHGRLSADVPLDSAIELANDEDLTLQEMMGLELRADLVVLSACNTGRGEITAANEVLGLTRGLLAAGGGATVVSLWPVDDQATTLLITRSYRYLCDGDFPALALSRAQSWLRSLSRQEAEHERGRLGLDAPRAPRAKQRDFPQLPRPEAASDYSHPYYWAPFIVVGR